MRRPARGAICAVAASLVLGACTGPGLTPTPTPTPTPHQDFVVTTTERPGAYDPAAATTSADAVVALNVFSRLMVVHPQDASLKPDLATDCLYTSATTYACDLPEGLTFHNGHALTASDVKFSIERAYRLGVNGGSALLLDALERIDVVDDRKVQFVLKWADTQFGYALATPAASIVDEELYDPDVARPMSAQPVGSGPYRLVTMGEDQLGFERFFDYRGATGGALDVIRLAFVADSAGAEAAIAAGDTDAVWRSLTDAAVARLTPAADPDDDRAAAEGFSRWPMPRVRVQRLVWNAASAFRESADLRNVVALALQADRTMTSLVPPTVTGAVDAFGVGGTPAVTPLGGQRVRMTLSYTSSAPGQADLARLLRDRIEAVGGLSVQLLPDAADADLLLTDRPAWVNTAFGWLQVYVDATLPGSRDKIDDLDRRARETTDAATRAALLAEIQYQAAADLTVLPLSNAPETLFVAPGVRLEGQPFGPGYQLGLWGFRR